MEIAIVGAGYVGLTTGVCLADLGHTVYCVDNDPKKVELLRKGQTPIFEPGLEELLKRNLQNKRLIILDNIADAAEKVEVIFICVNTPTRPDGTSELKYVEKVAKEIALSVGEGYKVIVDKSTVPVKTAEKVKETIVRYSTEKTRCDVVSNPEFLKEGTAIEDTMRPDRIVIGSDSDKATEVMLKVYKPIIERTKAPVKIVSVRSAELIKHGANTFLAMKISFANMVAHACEEANANAKEVLEAIGLDERIGSRFLNCGIGYGGSCFPKDIAAFKNTLQVLGVESSLIKSVEDVNEDAWKRFISRVEKELWVLDGKVIGVLGLSFKPDTDDMRNAPAINIIKELQEKGATVRVYDPHAMEAAKKCMPDITYCADSYEVSEGAEAILICTEWNEFSELDFNIIKGKMVVPIIFDGRNMLDPDKMKELGYKYFGVGYSK